MEPKGQGHHANLKPHTDMPPYDPQDLPPVECDEDLVEKISLYVHDSWAVEKRRQGKHIGHPDWKPYDELPDDVKEYDRVTVRTVLGALQMSGFEVVGA